MPGRGLETAAALAEIGEAVRALERRISHLEARLAPPEALTAGPDVALSPGWLEGARGTAAERPAAWLPGLGRAMLVLAGGFLLRTLTGAGTLQGTAGVALGLLYVLSCLRLTDRSARRQDALGASLLGAASALVGYPLLWETATKLHLLSPAAAAAALALVTAMGLAAGVRHRLWALGWIYVVAALATATGLAWQSAAPVLFAAEVVALAVATAWLAYHRGWWGPRWPAAAAANALVLLMVLLASRGEGPLRGRPAPDAGATFALALGLPLAYLGTFGAHLLRGRWRAGPFEVFQSAGAVAAGVLGAAMVQSSTGAPIPIVGWVVLPAAVAAQAVALVRRPAASGRSGNRSYFAALGLGLTLLATGLAVPGAWLTYLWAALGLAAAAGAVAGRPFLRLQSAACLGGAALAGGLAQAGLEALAAAPPLPALGLTGGAAWLAAVLGFCLLAWAPQPCPAAPGARLLRFLVAALVLAGAFAAAVTALAACFGGWAAAEAARLEALRTFLLAATAVALAAASRAPRLRELGWFVGPLLVASGLKLALQDLRHGTPASLFFGFTCFGVALLLAPRVRRRTGVHATTVLQQESAAAPSAGRF